MRRRAFITLLGGGAVAWPLAARAQQPAMPVVGWLANTSEAGSRNRASAFRQGLSAAGFVEGRNVAIEARYVENRLDRLPALAADLVRRQVAVIVGNNITTRAAKAVTSTTPIVFVIGGDPVESGLVGRLNRPGGNMTGISFNSAPINPKRLELLHELLPKPSVIAALIDASIENQSNDLVETARALSQQIVMMKVAGESEIDAAFDSIVQAQANAVFVGSSAFFVNRRRQIIALAARHALAASYELREFVEGGGLMSYGASDLEAYRRAGTYVARILKGEKPGDLPVELPTRYELVFNLATAKALKLDIPAKLLALADEVIE